MGATVTDPLVGHLVDGRYEVVQRIARGGMATVYLAVDRRLDREVALKVMHPHLAEGGSGGDFIARFRREARAAARLTHPGLVGVYDQGLDGETSYLTMEYVDGVNLRRHLAERGSLTVAETLQVAEQVLDALAAAHRVGLVHRDIKPENVLMASDGRVKLADFGLARAVTEVTATTTGTVFGTVAYLAPELVVRGESDARTDVYAAGVLVYEMLTGRQPFTGETPIQIAFQHVNSDIPAPSDSASWLPVEIDELIGALAARDPDDRPADAAAALAQLRRTRTALDPATLARRTDVEPTITLPSDTADGDPDDDEEHEDETPGAADEVSSSDAATTRIDALQSGRTVALPIGLVGSEVAAQDTPAPARSRRRLLIWLAAAVLLVGALGAGTWWYVNEGPGAYTTVPTVAGLTREEAVAVLDDAGLGSDVQEDYSDTAPIGTVATSDPADGEDVRKDGSVLLTVSRGPDVVSVPANLVGMSQAEASAAIEAADLTVDYGLDGEDDWSDTAAIGDVLAVTDADGTAVEADSQVKRGSALFLTLSDGPEPLTVQSVVGATLEVATSQLQGDGLVVDPQEAFSDTVPAGSVISQDPAGGSAGHRLDTVTLQVSKGPEMVDLPSIPYGSTVADATAALEAAGFKVETKHAAAFFGLNRVIGHSPDAAQAPKGSTVVLTIT
ncbi:MAG TPA: Stk1 family PASTA domain-containing Ser/Thr kinase [Cellulomonas sp.]